MPTSAAAARSAAAPLWPSEGGAATASDAESGPEESIALPILPRRSGAREAPILSRERLGTTRALSTLVVAALVIGAACVLVASFSGPPGQVPRRVPAPQQRGPWLGATELGAAAPPPSGAQEVPAPQEPLVATVRDLAFGVAGGDNAEVPSSFGNDNLRPLGFSSSGDAAEAMVQAQPEASGPPWQEGVARASEGVAEVATRAKDGAVHAASGLVATATEVITVIASRFGLGETTMTTTTPAPCDYVEENVNYPGNDLRSVQNVLGLGWCCYECAQDPDCVAWTWTATSGANGTCYLKGGRPRATLTKVPDPGFFAGLPPAQVGRSIQLEPPRPGASIYCWALVVASSYERGMILMEYEESTGIFQCDEYVTLSNSAVEVAPGVITAVVDSSLQCVKGGEFKTALNTDIFIAVWARVIQDGRYLRHDWTVKCDPDSVFFPNRLRNIVAYHPEVPQGVYLNNCDRGLHGPIEVFSRNAVTKWAQGRQACQDHFNALCAGPCLWGEDMFIDQCLEKVLSVSKQMESKLLVEEHCDPPPGWQECRSPDMVSFHPFKTVDSYKACVHNALQAAGVV